MGNRRATDKLPIPKWFRLANYLPLRDLMNPSDWLQQIAFRIDLMSLLNKLGPLTERPEESVFVDEFHFNEMLSEMQSAPIVPALALAERYSLEGLNFPTLSCVQAGYEPVRQMTAADLYIAEQALHPTTRRLARSFFWDAQEPVALENEPLHYVLGEDLEDVYAGPPSDVPMRWLFEADWKDVHGRLQEEKAHYRLFGKRGENSEVQHFVALLENWCVKSSPTAPYLFAIDPTAPPQLAGAAVRSRLEEIQAARMSVKEVSTNLFSKWVDDGVLAFIDLKLSERVTANRLRNPRLAFREEDLADAIYAKNPLRSSTCVSDTTRPVAESLMNSSCRLFRTLLNAGSGRPGDSSVDVAIG